MHGLRFTFAAVAMTMILWIPCFGQDGNMSMGFFSPNFSEGHTLYVFDQDAMATKSLKQPQPVDSITFKKVGYNYVIDHAPTGFAPVFNKLDYGIFFISVKKLGTDYVEVIANEDTQKTIYMLRQTGTYVSWEEILLSIHSVEFLTNTQKVFDHPYITSAGRVVAEHTYFQPKYIEGDWMYVIILNDSYESIGSGWIQWRKQNRLLIRYNLLS